MVGAARGGLGSLTFPSGSSQGEAATDVVERYLARLTAHDWDGVAECLADDVVRVGPYGDTYRGRPAYVAFLAGLMPRLPGYAMDVARVVYGADGRTATAELSETVALAGGPLVTPESLVFDLDTAGRISHIAIYVQRTGEAAPELAR